MTKISKLLDAIDGAGSDGEKNAIKTLSSITDLPSILLERYKVAKKWQIRVACVYYAIKYAKSSNDAILLGELAISDRSYVVRYRGCMLLAYAQHKEALGILKAKLSTKPDQATVSDLEAAIDAIENNNHHYFVDRKHTGKMFLNISD